MGRIADADERIREELEGNLAMLGNARVYLELVMGRVMDAVPVQAALLSPAIDDLMQADRLIKTVQQRIGE